MPVKYLGANKEGSVNLVYRCANTRKCYWLCRGCLKGHSRCSTKCPDYLSVAQARKGVVDPKDYQETHWDRLELERRLGN